MKIAHIADVHLGYRAYSRLTSEGVNQREEDVFQAFERVFQEVAVRDVDLIVIAGDLFHTVRPSNLTIRKAFRLMARFRRRYDTPIVIIGGNHDTPKSADVGCILDLFAEAIDGVHVRHHGFEGIRFDQLDATVYCLPYFALEERNSQVRPASASGTNILAVHGAIQGVMKFGHDPVEIDPGELYFDEWDYIAVGHYHIRSEIAPNCFYSGAIEYTSSNIWEETRGPDKGFIIYDTDERSAQFVSTPGLRSVCDLKPIRADGLGAAELMEKIDSAVQAVGSLEGKIARVVVESFPKQLHKELDWPRLRELKSQALHLDFVLRPEPKREGGDGAAAAGEARPLEAEWDDFAAGLDALPAGVDRGLLTQLGKDYLAKTSDIEVLL